MRLAAVRAAAPGAEQLADILADRTDYSHILQTWFQRKKPLRILEENDALSGKFPGFGDMVVGQKAGLGRVFLLPEIAVRVVEEAQPVLGFQDTATWSVDHFHRYLAFIEQLDKVEQVMAGAHVHVQPGGY